MKTTHTDNAHATRPRKHYAQRRGSAIILVIVSIVLMAILGATMVQVARFERIAKSEEHIDVVVDAVIDLIAVQMANDILDDNGFVFNPDASVGGGGDEPYDFGWTWPDNSYGLTAEHIDGTTVSVIGGKYDDRWLASNEPQFVDNVWPHITNLTGMYLQSGGSADLTNAASPDERPVTIANRGALGNDVSDTNIDFTNGGIGNLLVDSDGDGVGDSRWEWAPIRQIGGTRYVMAVRIIDLSARLDANVAMGQFHANPASPDLGEAIPRGDSPSEIDGTFTTVEYGNDVGLAPFTTRADWERGMLYRLIGTPGALGSVVPYGSPTSGQTRYHYFLKGASQVGTDFGYNGDAPNRYDLNYGLADAFNLLLNNGFNTAPQTLLEQHMSSVLRDTGGGGSEGTFASGTLPPGITTVQEHFGRNARLVYSPFTGCAIIALPAATAQNYAAQVDVNNDSKTALYNAIFDVINVGTFTSLAHLTTTADYSAQLAANIKDYADDDNHVTLVNGKAGLEALPYIAEVYVQRFYNNPAPAENIPPGGTWDVTWTSPSADNTGYAIEIGNPFAENNAGWGGRTVELTDVHLFINGVDIGELSVLAGITELPPGDTLILYHDSADGPVADNDVSAIIGAAGYANVHTAVLNNTLNNGRPFSRQVDIELRAKEDMGAAAGAAPMGWGYSACEVFVPGATIVQDGFTVDPTGLIFGGYIQRTYQGHGQSLNMMAVLKTASAADFDNRPAAPDADGYAFGEQMPASAGNSPGDNTRSSTLDALGEANKAGPTTIDFTGQQIIVDNNAYADGMRWIGDILQIPVIGPDPATADTTMAATLALSTIGATDQVEDLMLPYKPTGTNAIDNSSFAGMLNVPHGVLLLERLTTMSPLADGEDNDGDGIIDGDGDLSTTTDDDDEVLVPGRINLNTASQKLLERALPFPDQLTREYYAWLIVTRRDNPNVLAQDGVTTTQMRGGVPVAGQVVPGIAYTGELFDEAGSANGVNFTNAAGTPRVYTSGGVDGGDTVNAGAGGYVDFNNDETAEGTTWTLDGVTDDREEEIMLTKWLNEVGATRSDVYAAYIVVQGYPAGDFRPGPVEAARLIVVFSRANVRNPGDKAQVLGTFRLQ